MLSFLSTGLLIGQSWKDDNGITGKGPVVEKQIELDNFDQIGLAINADVILEKGPKQKVKIKAQQNIIDNITREVKKDSWSIKFDENVRNAKEITIYITLPNLEALSIAGNGNIIGKSPFNGMGDLTMNIAGNGDIEFSGSTNSLSINIAGNGDIRAERLKAENCEVSIAGNGDCYISVDKDLSVSIVGSGDVNYKGSPRIKSSVIGSGDINSL